MQTANILIKLPYINLTTPKTHCPFFVNFRANFYVLVRRFLWGQLNNQTKNRQIKNQFFFFLIQKLEVKEYMAKHWLTLSS